MNGCVAMEAQPSANGQLGAAGLEAVEVLHTPGLLQGGTVEVV